MQEKRMNQNLLKREPLLELCELFVCGLALTIRHTATHIRRKQQSAVSVPLRLSVKRGMNVIGLS